jgi:hypothetical protein
MQLFMRNIAFSASDTDIRLALALKLHSPPFPLDPPTNFDIDLFKSKQGKPIGLLTLPTNELGNIFLRTYGQTGISVQYRTIYFSLSNKQRDGHIEKVRASAWEDPRILQEQKKRMAEISEPISLLRFSFGCFCRDGSFSAEINTSGTSTVVCNTEPRQVRLEVTPNKSSRVIFGIDVSEFSSPTVVFATYTPSQITATAFSAPLNGSFHFFLESDSPPVFGSYCKQDSFLGLSVKEVSERRPSLIEGREMPPACQHLCLTFASRSDLDTFAERCKTIHLPGARESDIRLVARRIHTEGKLARLDKFIEKLEFGLAFEAEKAVITGVLEPNDVRKLLKEDVLKLQHDYELSAAHIFRYFAGALRVPGLSPNKDRRRNRPRRRRGDAPAPTSTSPHTSSLVQQLREAISRYTEELRQPLRRYSLSPALFQSYHLILTPTKRVLEGPLPDQSNSVLRRFGHHESFLRVSFQDENGSKLRRDPNISITGLLKSRFRPLLIDGFRLAGRKFDFLGYSMSGLKEYSLWFVNPFQGDDNLTMDATRIRDQLVSIRHFHV